MMKLKSRVAVAVLMSFCTVSSVAALDYAHVLEKAQELKDSDFYGYLEKAKEYKDEMEERFAPVLDAASDVKEAIPDEIKGALTEAQVRQQKDPWDIEDELMLAIDTMASPLDFLDCVDHRILGFCISLKTSWWPKLYFTTIQENYSRDSHIEVRNTIRDVQIGDIFSTDTQDKASPTSAMVGGLASNIATGLGNFISWLGDLLYSPSKDQPRQGEASSDTSFDESGYVFKEVMVMGSPENLAIDAYMSLITFNTWCSSSNMPWVPYFHSSQDVLSWRWMATSEVLSMGSYGVKQLAWDDIGSGYGSTFPRSGYIQQRDPFKASVVAAYRGFDIVTSYDEYTSTAGLHVSNTMDKWASSTWQRDGYLTSETSNKKKLQMIYPFQGEMCTRYKNRNSLFDSDMKRFMDGNAAQSAAFKGYRAFRCCRKRGNKFLTNVMLRDGNL
ncbi:hypothetical protein A6E01_19270 (plasmid) [Vibrio breoganii]|uniref:TIGR03756 family integrating conjugative element protein n=1 Tax=Vibrio breoganii TaxID=553239 RepID=A0AAN0XZE3_9VIBR|nr:TraU family protein [Vibrio breoganii]ANO35356.1 hypothetical protein A6E01_19270 [Vibrio breoganii]